MGKIATMARNAADKVKSIFRNDDRTPPTGAVPVGYAVVPEPIFRNPNAAKPMNRMVHVSKELEEVPPALQAMFGLPPFVVSNKRGNTLVLGRNWAKRRSARLSKMFGDHSLMRKQMRRAELERLSA